MPTAINRIDAGSSSAAAATDTNWKGMSPEQLTGALENGWSSLSKDQKNALVAAATAKLPEFSSTQKAIFTDALVGNLARDGVPQGLTKEYEATFKAVNAAYDKAAQAPQGQRAQLFAEAEQLSRYGQALGAVGDAFGTLGLAPYMMDRSERPVLAATLIASDIERAVAPAAHSPRALVERMAGKGLVEQLTPSQQQKLDGYVAQFLAKTKLPQVDSFVSMANKDVQAAFGRVRDNRPHRAVNVVGSLIQWPGAVGGAAAGAALGTAAGEVLERVNGATTGAALGNTGRIAGGFVGAVAAKIPATVAALFVYPLDVVLDKITGAKEPAQPS